jgi:acetyl esterase
VTDKATIQSLIGGMERAFPSIRADSRAEDIRKRYDDVGTQVITQDIEPVGAVHDRSIRGADGDIAVRIYQPHGAGDTPLPVVLFYHGGGFVLCGLDSHDAVCRATCNASGCIVVAVDYRLAPEYPFPSGVEDCYAALQWVADHAFEVGGDADRIAVVGDSAGGNLAAAVALLARDRSGPRLCHQVLVYPMLDPRADTPSHREVGPGFYLLSEEVQWFWAQYLTKDDWQNPYASPTSAADLTGLPPALVVTAENDPLRDEGERYAAALSAAGVDVTLHRYDDMFHSFMSFLAELEEARDLMAEIAGVLGDAFGHESESSRRSEKGIGP